MTRLEMGGEEHDERYPKPAWLRQMLGEPVDERMRLTLQDFPLYTFRATMAYAVDGDTIHVRVELRRGDNREVSRLEVIERIRLLGYNAPERYNPGGPEATQHLEVLIPPGSEVLGTAFEDRRSFNRMLAWAYADTGGSALLDVAAAMIASGHGTKA